MSAQQDILEVFVEAQRRPAKPKKRPPHNVLETLGADRPHPSRIYAWWREAKSLTQPGGCLDPRNYL